MSIEYSKHYFEHRGVDTKYQRFVANEVIKTMDAWIGLQRQNSGRGIDLVSYYLSMPYVPGVADPAMQSLAAASVQPFAAIEVLQRYMSLFSEIFNDAHNSELHFYSQIPYQLLHTQEADITTKFGSRATSDMMQGMQQAEQTFLDLIANPVQPLIPYKLGLAQQVTKVASLSDNSHEGYFETIIPHVYVKYKYLPNETSPQRSVTVIRQ